MSKQIKQQLKKMNKNTTDYQNLKKQYFQMKQQQYGGFYGFLSKIKSYDKETNYDKLTKYFKLSLNQSDHQGNTPVHYAVLSNNANALKHIILRGGNIRQKNNKGKTPIDLVSNIKYLDKQRDLIRFISTYNILRNTKKSTH